MESGKGCLEVIGGLTLAVVLVLGGCVVLAIYRIPDTPQSAPPTAEQKEQQACEDSYAAIGAAMQFTRQTLKAPSTAKFPHSREFGVDYLGNCIHDVEGYVDAQNSFGAMIRTPIRMKVQYSKTLKGWIVAGRK